MITVTVTECIQRLRSWRESAFQEQPRKPYGPVVKGIYRGLFEIQEYCVKIVTTQWSIGRRIWGPDKYDMADVNVWDYIHPTRVEGMAGGYRMGMIAIGLPAMMEKGGRTKPHFIRPKEASFKRTSKQSTATLTQYRVRRGAFTLVGGGVLKLGDRYVRLVQRHTSAIPKKSYIAPYIRAADIYIVPAIERNLSRAAEAFNG